MIKILHLPLGPLQTNCYILACTQTNQAAAIDPSWDGRAIASAATEQGWTITHILLTHAHFDHVGGLAELKELTGAPIYAHPGAAPMLSQADRAAAIWQITLDSPPPPDQWLSEGQKIKVGEQTLELLYTPGHAPGHVCFYLAEQNVLFDGDVLFQGSIGRTDLPGGDYDTLIQNIRQKLLVLPDETIVLSGHGPATTIGRERNSNPFLQD
jgi:glyoxylase-like metal-dependent hydrolase (beta-lactamase superfamily II)